MVYQYNFLGTYVCTFWRCQNHGRWFLNNFPWQWSVHVDYFEASHHLVVSLLVLLFLYTVNAVNFHQLLQASYIRKARGEVMDYDKWLVGSVLEQPLSSGYIFRRENTTPLYQHFQNRGNTSLLCYHVHDQLQGTRGHQCGFFYFSLWVSIKWPSRREVCPMIIKQGVMCYACTCIHVYWLRKFLLKSQGIGQVCPIFTCEFCPPSDAHQQTKMM